MFYVKNVLKVYNDQQNQVFHMLERRKLRVRFPEPSKILPILVCRKSQVDESFMEEKMKQLRKNLKSDIKILEYAVVNEEKDIPILKEHSAKADAILIYKPHLGLGDCIIEISESGLPTILFKDRKSVV